MNILLYTECLKLATAFCCTYNILSIWTLWTDVRSTCIQDLHSDIVYGWILQCVTYKHVSLFANCTDPT